jgi:hypothetical protein
VIAVFRQITGAFLRGRPHAHHVGKAHQRLEPVACIPDRAISIPQRRPDPLTRACFAEYWARTPGAGRVGASGVVKQRWPDDRLALAILERAAISGATTTTAGWAAELTYSATGSFLESLGSSAASRLIPKGMQVPFPAGASSVKLPIRPVGAVAAAVVGEGSPIPCAHVRKLGCLIVASREVATPETVFRRLLEEDAAISLDSFVFGTGAGGLLNGLSPIVPAAGQGGYPSQVLADLGILARAAQVAGGSGETIFVAGPAAAGQVAVPSRIFRSSRPTRCQAAG